MTESWSIRGTYFEACNCDAICPCRREGGVKKGAAPTYDDCEFALSWRITAGSAGSVDLAGLQAVMVGAYRYSEPGMPWRVTLLVDDAATAEQREALADILLGRAGGTPRQNYAQRILEVHDVRGAHITLDHTPARQTIRAGDSVVVRGLAPVPQTLPITCGIPGHDAPGVESTAETLLVDEGPFHFELHGRCAFSADFDYRAS
jgi:hypothetical protein